MHFFLGKKRTSKTTKHETVPWLRTRTRIVHKFAVRLTHVNHCTRSNVEEVLLTHLSLTQNIDFEQTVLTCRASWTAAVQAPTANLIFDTRAPAVKRVTVDGLPAKFALREVHEAFGAPLTALSGTRIPPANVTEKILEYRCR